MTAADLSANFDDLDGTEANSEFGDLQLPALTTGEWRRNIPTQCDGCAKACNEHKVFDDIGFGPASSSKAILSQLIDHSNDVRARVRTWQSIIQQMHLAVHGVYESTEQSIAYSPVFKTVSWPVASVASGSVTLTYADGTQDPRALMTSYLIDNPDYGLPGEPKYLTIEEYNALGPRGILSFNAPSMLRNFNGWIVKKIDCDESLAIGNTFTVYVEGFDGTEALTKIPADSVLAIEATIKYYPPYADELWADVRDCYPLWCKRKSTIFTGAGGSSYTLEASARIKSPSDAQWFSAVDKDGNPLTWGTRVDIVQGPYGWSTLLDVPDITAIQPVTVTYWIESTAADAINAGQSRCKWSIHDYTGSWGATDGMGTAYCAKRKEVGDHIDGATALSRYRPECYQPGVCPYWTEDGGPTDPLAAIEQIIYSHPYKVTIQRGATDDALSRFGCPSLYSLTAALRTPPEGLQEKRRYNTQAGGWEVSRVNDGELYADVGLDWLYTNDARQVPLFTNSETYPSYGPGGNNIANRMIEYGATAAADANDPHRIERAQVLSRDADLDPYNGTVSGDIGKRQRLGFRHSKIFLPAIGSASGQERVGGTIYRGFWDANFQPCSEGSETYKVKVVLSGPFWGRYGGEVTTATISFAEAAGSYVRLHLAHKTISATSPIEVAGELVESTTSWKQGGTNVALPVFSRVWNYDCSQSFHGPGQSFAKPGHAVQFPTASFTGTILDNHALWITYAKACGSSTAGSWKPTPDGLTEAQYYAANVSIHSGGDGLPFMHSSWANLYDVIDIYDPLLLASTYGVANLAGKSISIRSDGVMMDGGTIYQSYRNSPDPDAVISGAKLIGTSGEVFIPELDNYEGCIIVDGYSAVRDGMPFVSELDAIITTLGRMIGE